MERRESELRELQTFLVQLGAALNIAGEPAYSVQERLADVARVNGADDARIRAFPTSLMVTLGRAEPVALELAAPSSGPPRLDRISALHRLVEDAETGRVTAADGLRRLGEIRALKARFGPVVTVLGYSVLAMGICLLLSPAARQVAAAALFGALVGVLRSLVKGQSTLETLTPVLAAFVVSALSALAVQHDLTDPGVEAMVASLVVFLPGSALTTAVLELAAGQMVSGSSRLVSGAMQLALLTFGIMAGIQAIGVSSAEVLSRSGDAVGDWTPWLGVLIYAVGATVAHSVPRKALLGLLLVLAAASVGQYVGNVVFGGYVSAFIGALAMTPAAYAVSLIPSAMPARASFLPAFWLLVPGALGLIGLTGFAGLSSAAGAQDLLATAASIFAIALGVLCGTQLLAWALEGRTRLAGIPTLLIERRAWQRQLRAALADEPPAAEEDEPR